MFGEVFIGLFCAWLFGIMRGGTAAFGRTIGTLMGISFLGFIFLGGGYLIAMVLVCIVIPFAIPAFFMYLFFKAINSMGHKTDEKHEKPAPPHREKPAPQPERPLPSPMGTPWRPEPAS